MPPTGSRSIRPSRRNTLYNVEEYGGIPGDQTGSTDAALEKIWQKITARNAAYGGIGPNVAPAQIYFPGNTKQWYLRRPFFIDWSYVEVVGDGEEQSTVAAVQGLRQDCFVFGLSRRPAAVGLVGYDGSTPMVLSPDHWTDLYGIADNTSTPTPGMRWGLNLKNDSFLTFPLSPFSHAISDGWALTRQLTIDFWVDLGAGNQFGDSELFGMGQIDGSMMGASPWYVKSAAAGNTIKFYFNITGSTSTPFQAITFSCGAATGKIRLTLQIDLAAGTAATFVNRVQVAVVTGTSLQFDASLNMAFRRNFDAPFNVGKRSLMAINQLLAAPANFTVLAIKLSNTIRFASGAVGSAQVYAGTGTAPTDNDQYYTYDGSTIACLPLLDPPTGNAACTNDGRVVTVKGSNSSTVHGLNFTAGGYFLHTFVGGTPVYTQQNRIRDITVINGTPTPSGLNGTPTGSWMTTFGRAIALGAVWEMSIKRVRARSNGQGVGQINTGAVFSTRIDDLYAGGGDAGLYLYYGGLILKNYNSDIMGRFGIRLSTCYSTMDNIFLGDSAIGTLAGLYLAGGEYGGIHKLSYFNHDSENGKGPTVASVVAEGHYFNPTTLCMDLTTIGKVANGAVLFKLVDNNPYPGADYTATGIKAGTHRFVLNGLAYYRTNHVAHIMTDGTLWSVEADGFQCGTGGRAASEAVPTFLHTGPGGIGRGTLHVRDYGALPTTGTWSAGVILEIQNPAPGTYERYRCVQSGTYGTGTLPLWSGIGMLATATS